MSELNKMLVKWQKLKQNLLLRRLFTVLSLDILVKGSAILLLPIYLRLMTPEEYGLYNYILSIVYALAVCLNLGLFIPQSKLYHDYHSPQEKGKLFYNIHALLLLGLFSFLLPVYFFQLDYEVISILFKNPINYQNYRVWILIMTLVSLFSFMLTNYLYTAERISLIKKYSLARTFGVNLIGIAGLYFYKKNDAIETRLVIAGLTELVLIFIFYKFYVQQMRFVIDKTIIIKSLRMGLPIMLATLFSIIINFGDKFFLEKYVNYKNLSVYYLAFACAGVISIVSNSLQNIWLPLFLKEKDLKKNMAITKKMINKLMLILVGLGIIIMTGVIICLKLLIIPKDYYNIVYLLPILITAQIAVCIALLYSNYLTYFEKTGLVSWAGLFISAISVIMNILLIPALGIYGAATTLLISNLLYLLIYYLALRYYSDKHLKESVI